MTLCESAWTVCNPPQPVGAESGLGRWGGLLEVSPHWGIFPDRCRSAARSGRPPPVSHEIVQSASGDASGCDFAPSCVKVWLTEFRRMKLAGIHNSIASDPNPAFSLKREKKSFLIYKHLKFPPQGKTVADVKRQLFSVERGKSRKKKKKFCFSFLPAS